MITVFDFVSLLCEDSRIKIWDSEEGRVIYDGSSYDIPMKIMRLEIGGIDGIFEPVDHFTLNV